MSDTLLGDEAPVDEAARRRFEADWAAGTPGPIEDYLPDAGAPLLFNLGLARYRNGEAAEAKDAFLRALDASGGTYDLAQWEMLAHSAFAAGDLVTAAVAFRKILDLPDHDRHEVALRGLRRIRERGWN